MAATARMALVAACMVCAARAEKGKVVELCRSAQLNVKICAHSFSGANPTNNGADVAEGRAGAGTARDQARAQTHGARLQDAWPCTPIAGAFGKHVLACGCRRQPRAAPAR